MNIKSEWLAHPLTGEFLSYLRGSRAANLQNLISVGLRSSDPEVVQFAVAVNVIDKLITLTSKTVGDQQ